MTAAPRSGPIEQLLHATVRLETTDSQGQRGAGTAFYFRFPDPSRPSEQMVPVLVTNRHVVAGVTSASFNVSTQADDGGPALGKHVTVELADFEAAWHPHPTLDLCIMPIGPLMEALKAKGHRPYYVMIDVTLLAAPEVMADLLPLDEVVFVGYPTGLSDVTNNLPIMRRGVAASSPSVDFNGKPEFLIDAACLPGSSGSPVLLWNNGSWVDRQGNTILGSRVAMLGVLSSGPPLNLAVQGLADGVSAVTVAPANLGYVIKADRLRDFEPIIARLVGAPPV